MSRECQVEQRRPPGEAVSDLAGGQGEVSSDLGSGGKSGAGKGELETSGVLDFSPGHLLSGLAEQDWQEGLVQKQRVFLSIFYTLPHSLTPFLWDFHSQTQL